MVKERICGKAFEQRSSEGLVIFQTGEQFLGFGRAQYAFDIALGQGFEFRLGGSAVTHRASPFKRPRMQRRSCSRSRNRARRTASAFICIWRAISTEATSR